MRLFEYKHVHIKETDWSGAALAAKHSNTFLFYAFDMEISSTPSRNLFMQTQCTLPLTPLLIVRSGLKV